MGKKFYISDLHLGHANAIKFDNRPFSSVDEMTEVLVANWNSVVSRGDEVYVLGDFAWHSDTGIDAIRRMNGQKFLVVGNHDRLKAELEKEFVWCKPYDEVRDGDHKVVLCHYPIAHWHNADHGTIHLYGHIHASRDSRPFNEYVEMMKQRGIPYFCYNVGCMLPYMGYMPRTLDEIIAANNKI